VSIGKRYYLKLESDFFQRLKVKKLRKAEKGDVYTCIYLKLMLLSTKDFGLITFKNIESTLYEELALIIDEEINDVKNTMDFLEKEGILLQTDDSEYLFENLCDEVVTETESARRMRRHREKIKEKSIKITMLSQCDNGNEHCDHNVITVLSQCESAKSHCDHNVVTMLSHCDNEKTKDTLPVKKNSFISSLGDDIIDKIIPVVDSNEKEKQDG